jgi:hypothetical protein
MELTKTQIENAIEVLKNADGEDLQNILENIGMDEQILKQLSITRMYRSNLTETKKVVISTRAVYHKYAEVTIEVPSNIKDEDVDTWITNNDNFSEKLDDQLGVAEYEYGLGLDGNMNQIEETYETRFDVYNSKGEITYGGHC